MIALIAGLAAAVAWSFAVSGSARAGRVTSATTVVAWTAIVEAVAAAPWSIGQGIPAVLGGRLLVWFFVAGAASTAGLMLGVKALQTGRIGVTAPILSTEGAIAAVIGLVAGESASAPVIIALAVIACGVLLASIPRSHAPHGPSAGRSGQGPAIVSALSFGLGLYGMGRLSAQLSASWALWSAGLVGTVAVAVPMAARGTLIPRRARGLVLGAAVAEAAGYFAYVLAAQHNVAIAAVVSSQFAGIALLASVAAGERLARIQVAGITAMLVGVAVLGALQH